MFPIEHHGKRKLALGALLLIAVAGTVWRVWPIRDSLWVDELHTAWTVAGELSDISPRAMLGNNGPLYFTIVHACTRLLGVSEVSLRLLSVLAGVGLIVATYGISRTWNCSQPASLLAAMLVTMDSNNLFFAGEARTYALIQLVAIGQLYCCWRMFGDGTWGWIWCWVLAALMLFHLHCTTSLLLLAQLTAFVCCRRACRACVNLKPATFVMALLVIGLGCLPAADLLRTVAERRENWQQFINQQQFLATLTIFPLHAYLLVPVLFACLAAVLPSKTATQSGTDQHAALLIICGCWLFVPIVAAWGLTETDLARLFFRRYLIGSSVALAPLTAILLTQPGPRGWAAPCGWCAVLVVGLMTMSPLKHGWDAAQLAHGGEGWREAITRMNRRELPVLLRSGLIEADAWHDADDPLKREYCELPVRGIYQMANAQAVVISLPTTRKVTLTSQQRDRLASRGGAWLLARGRRADLDRCLQEVLSAMPGTDATVVSERNFGRVRLIELRFR